MIARGWSSSLLFADDGVSGSHGDRAAFKSMLAAARKRTFDVLVVYRSDRLFRSLTELVTTIDELAELGIGFVSVTEPFDTTTSSGRLLLQICGAFAEFERNVMIERTKSGLDAARRRGATLGRPRRVVDVGLVLRMRATGMENRAIARELEISEATLYRALSNDAGGLEPDVDGAGELAISEEH